MFTQVIRRNKGLILFLLILFILLILYSVLRVPVVRVNNLKGKIINGEVVYRGNYERTGYYPFNPILSEPKLDWSFTIPRFLNENSQFPSYSHIAYKNYVFFVDSNGILHALNADSGKEIWKIEEEGFGCGKPWLITDNVLFYIVKESFLSPNEAILGVDINDGREVFRLNLPNDEVVDKSGFIIKDNILYFAVMKLGRHFGIGTWPYIPEERFYAIDLSNNKIIWRVKEKCNIENYNPYSSVCTFSWYSNNTLYYYNHISNTLISIDPNSGKIKKRTEITLDDAVPIVDGKFFLKDSIYDLETGETIWSMNLNYKYFTTPAIKGGTVYFAASNDKEGNVFALDIDSHEEKWKAKVGKIVNPHFFLIANSHIYLYEYETEGTQLICLDTANGKILWKYDPLKAIPDFDKIRKMVDEPIYIGWRESFTNPIPEFDEMPSIGNEAIYIPGVDGLYKIH